MVKRGEIWWADLPEPVGSGPGYRRPVLVVQDDDFNQSPIKTVIVATITGNLNVGRAKGNVLISSDQAGLTKDSAINVSALFTIDKSLLFERVGNVSFSKMQQVDNGLRLVLSLVNDQ